MQVRIGAIDESTFWRRVYEELRGNWLSQLEPLGFPDWIEPRRYAFGSYEPHVKGRLGLIGGRSSEVGFVLYFKNEPEGLADIEWSNLLSGCRGTKWVSYDADLETIILDPATSN